MSHAARTALISTGTNRQGATPAPITPIEALTELTRLGLIGHNNGLTRRGTIKREQIINEEFDAAF